VAFGLAGYMHVLTAIEWRTDGVTMT